MGCGYADTTCGTTTIALWGATNQGAKNVAQRRCGPKVLGLVEMPSPGGLRHGWRCATSSDSGFRADVSDRARERAQELCLPLWGRGSDESRKSKGRRGIKSNPEGA